MEIHRRQVLDWFLRSGAVCGASLVPTAAWGGTVYRSVSQRKAAMTFSIGNYGMQGVAPEQAIERVANLGYDGIELCVREEWPTAPARLNARSRTSLRKRLEDSHLQVSAIMEHLPPTPGEAAERHETERLTMAAALAHDLVPDASPLIQTVLGGGDWEAKRDFLRDRLGAWVKAARGGDFRIAIKPHRVGAMSRPAQARWIIEQLGEPQELGLVYDYSHYAFRGIGVAESIQEAKGSILHVAIKDVLLEQGRHRFELPGATETFDYVGLFRELAEAGYASDICCEVSSMVWQREGYNPWQAAERCYQAIAPQMDEAGVRYRDAERP